MPKLIAHFLYAQLLRRIGRKELPAVQDSLDLLQNHDLSVIIDGWMPLHYAVKMGDIKILKAIVDEYSRRESKGGVKKIDEIKKIIHYQYGQEYNAADYALVINNVEATDFFIRQGCYNLEANLDPELPTHGDSNAVKHLLKTRELYALLRSGTTTLQAVKKLVAEGAVLTNSHLQKYVAKESKKSLAVDPAEIEKVVQYIIENGVKVNAEFQYAGSPPVTPLQKAVNGIASTAPKYSTYIAIALLKNSAGFNLDAMQKENLVKGILKYDPEYIKILLTKRWIKKDFKANGLPIDKYVATIDVDQSIADFITALPSYENLIDKKKAKSLRDHLVLQNRQIANKAVAENMRGELVPGINTSSDTHFSTTQEAGRTKKFLEKRSDGIIQHFGNQLLRILSNGQFVVKRGVLIMDEHNKPYFATKWDSSIAGNRCLQNGLPAKTESVEFLKNYGRLCGVVQVLGEHDWNSLNFLKSSKNGKPVKIDNAPLVNAYDTRIPQRIYGSNQSKLFLQFLAGENVGDSNPGSTIAKIREKLKKLELAPISTQTIALAAAAYRDEYNAGIDDDLLEKIKINITKNPELKDVFVEFMGGIESAIDLADDTIFLEKYAAKYQKEVGKSAVKPIATCRGFLLQNAQEAQRQFKNYLTYYDELKFAQIVDKVDKKGRNALHLAAYNGHTETVAAFLADRKLSGTVLALKDNNGRNALHLAVINGHTETVKAILTSDNLTGAILALKDIDGHNALHLAVINGHTDIAKAFLESSKLSGTVLALQDNDGHNALHLAVIQGDTETVKAFLESNLTDAFLELKDSNGHNALHLVVIQGDTETVTAFLASRKLTETFLALKDNDGHNALDLAVIQGDTETVKAFLASNLTDAFLELKDSNGHNALHLAVIQGDTETVTAFLASRKLTEAFLALKDNDGHNALDLAVIHGHTETVKALLEAGAVLRGKSFFFRDNPIYIATLHGNNQLAADLTLITANQKILHNLIKNKKPLEALNAFSNTIPVDKNKTALCIMNSRNTNHENAISCAIENKNGKALKWLLEKGASPYLPTSKDMDSLILAIKSKDNECIKILLEHNAKSEPKEFIKLFASEDFYSRNKELVLSILRSQELTGDLKKELCQEYQKWPMDKKMKLGEVSRYLDAERTGDLKNPPVKSMFARFFSNSKNKVAPAEEIKVVNIGPNLGEESTTDNEGHKVAPAGAFEEIEKRLKSHDVPKSTTAAGKRGGSSAGIKPTSVERLNGPSQGWFRATTSIIYATLIKLLTYQG